MTDYLAVGYVGSPWQDVFTRAGDTITSLGDLPSVSASVCDAVAWNPAGDTLAVAHRSSTYLSWYTRSGDTFTRLANPASLPAPVVTGLAWSPDGVYLACSATAAGNHLVWYSRSGDTLTQLTAPTGVPDDSSAYALAWNNDGSLLAVVHGAAPFLTVYSRSGDTLTKLTDLAGGDQPPDTTFGLAWSPDGSLLVVAHVDAPYSSAYAVSGTTLTPVTAPSGLPNTGWSAAFTPDGTVLAVGHSSPPYLSLFTVSGTTFSAGTGPDTPPTGLVHAVRFSRDGTLLTASQDSPLIYEVAGTALTALAGSFGPASGVLAVDWAGAGPILTIACPPIEPAAELPPPVPGTTLPVPAIEPAVDLGPVSVGTVTIDAVPIELVAEPVAPVVVVTVVAAPITVGASVRAPELVRARRDLVSPVDAAVLPVTRPAFTVLVVTYDIVTADVVVVIEVANNDAFIGPIYLSVPTALLIGSNLITATVDEDLDPGLYYWRASLTIDFLSLTPTAARTFTVDPTAGDHTIPLTWTVAAGPTDPHLWAVSPAAGQPGDTVTLFGQGFPDTGAVLLDGTELTVLSWTTTIAATGAASTDARIIDPGADPVVDPEHDEIVIVIPDTAATPGGQLTVTGEAS